MEKLELFKAVAIIKGNIIDTKVYFFNGVVMFLN